MLTTGSVFFIFIHRTHRIQTDTQQTIHLTSRGRQKWLEYVNNDRFRTKTKILPAEMTEVEMVAGTMQPIKNSVITHNFIFEKLIMKMHFFMDYWSF